MITPNDIQTKEFSKGVRGYKEDEVDVFLDELTIDLENILNEMEALRQRNAELEQKLNDYKSQEGAVVRTLETAKSLMNDISASAEKRADILIRNAEIDAAAIVRQAKDNLVNLQAEEKMLNERITSLKTRFRALLEGELSHFDELSVGTATIQTAEIAQATEEFESIIKSVESTPAEKDFFDDDAFNNLQNDLTKTIVSMRKDIE